MIKFFYSLIITFMAFTGLFGQKTPIIVDADTGNEMDDFYAITSALLDKELEVKALISAHFNNDQLLTDSVWHIYPTEDINTVQISQDENIKLLESLNKIDIPHPIGCDRMVGYAWGYYPGAPVPSSPGVDYIISQAKNVKNGKKLNIVCLGAVTNVAAAILTDTSIAKNIRLYALNMKYDIEKEIWDKNSFNARNDINGLDVILNNKDLEIYIMPGNVSRKMKFKRQESIKKLTNLNHPIAKILSKRWDEVNAGNSWIMWDLALIEAISKPNLAHLEKTNTPPENVTQKIGVYTDIEASKMKKRFWEKIERLK